MVYEITDESFEAEVANCDKPCVIEFTAGWCTMCEQKKLRIKFAVAAYPYIVLVADGMKTPLFDELVTAERLKERIDFVLNGGKAPTTRPL